MVITIIIVEIVAIVSNVNTELMAAGANLATTFATFLSFSYIPLSIFLIIIYIIFSYK